MRAPGHGPPTAPSERDDRTMLKIAARFLLLRFLPRRIVPVVTVVEALLFVRSIRKRPPFGVAHGRA